MQFLNFHKFSQIAILSDDGVQGYSESRINDEMQFLNFHKFSQIAILSDDGVQGHSES